MTRPPKHPGRRWRERDPTQDRVWQPKLDWQWQPRRDVFVPVRSHYGPSWRAERASEEKLAFYDRVTNHFSGQYPPAVVQIEPVEGCLWRCPSCAVAGIRHQGLDSGSASDIRTMRVEDAVHIVAQIRCLGWTDTRIEISGRGEPLMHPRLVEMVRLMRADHRSIPIYLLTSGMGMTEQPGMLTRLIELFGAGVNCITITEHDERIVRAALDIRRVLTREGIRVQENPGVGMGASSKRIRPPMRILTFRSPPGSTGTYETRRRNMAGVAGQLSYEYMDVRCPRPFRELAVRWDGNVALCSDDWRGVYKCGSVLGGQLAAVWDGEPMVAARRQLMVRRRDIALCRNCDSHGQNTDNLPDPDILMTLRPPDDESAAAVARAQEGAPYTPPVRRAWEMW